jgi:TetR/AcrR family transcriptional regulator
MNEQLTTRERLVESAVAEFAEKGLAGARIKQIAQNASANIQLVYHYFGNKEGLYAETLAHVLARSRATDDDLRLDELSPTEALTCFIEHVVNSSFKDVQYQRLLLDANWHKARHIDPAWASVNRMGRRVELLADVLARGASAGLFRSDLDPREVYISIMGTLSIRQTNAYSLSKTLGADLLTPEGRARSQAIAMDFLLHGLVAGGLTPSR